MHLRCKGRYLLCEFCDLRRNLSREKGNAPLEFWEATCDRIVIAFGGMTISVWLFFAGEIPRRNLQKPREFEAVVKRQGCDAAVAPFLDSRCPYAKHNPDTLIRQARLSNQTR